jgi:lysozyme
MTDLDPLNIPRFWQDMPHQREALLYWWGNTPTPVRVEFARLWRQQPRADQLAVNAAGIRLIKEFEGLRLQSYRCPAGVWTIGYGHTATAKPGQTITEAEADRLLRQDLALFEECVRSAVRIPVTQNQFSALVSLAFNIGCGALQGSTLIRLLNANKVQEAAQEFLRWVNANGKPLPGLVRRRQAERTLFLQGDT